MTKKKNISDEKFTYEQALQKFMEENNPIKHHDKKIGVFTPKDGEYFIRVYKANDPRREHFPKYWLLSNLGNLISMNNGTPKLLKPDCNKGNYYSYAFWVPVDDADEKTLQYKKMYLHIMTGLAFGSYCYGSAEKILDEEGIFAFGRVDEEGKVNCHHMYDREMNEADKLEFLPTEVHALVTEYAKKSAPTERETMEFLNNIAKYKRDESDCIIYYDTDKGAVYDHKLSLQEENQIRSRLKNSLIVRLIPLNETKEQNDYFINHLDEIRNRVSIAYKLDPCPQFLLEEEGMYKCIAQVCKVA